MRTSLRALTAITLVLALCTAAGCLSRFGYGSIRPAPEEKSIQSLVSNWRDYHVSYSGLNPGQPSGLMFDPRHDDRELKGERWYPVRDRETLDEILMWLRAHDLYPPRLLQLIGPEQILYGYVYTGWPRVVVRAVDTQTMYVLGLPAPLPSDPKMRDR
jgi:hypothetical protein